MAIAINLFFAGVLTIILPPLKTAFKTRGTVGFFAATNLVAFIMVFLLVEETRRLSLEELDLVYGYPKSKFINYQLRQRLPYFIRRYIFLQSKVDEPVDYDQFLLTQSEHQ